MECRACGARNPADSRFCDQCGTPLAASCPECGASNRPDARFCATCGTQLQAAATGPATAPGIAEPAASRDPAAERRLVSVLFADLVGFTALAEDRDPETVRDLLTRYFDTATQIVQLHGGTVEKFIGDAVMAVWGTPIAHEDDAERAVRAALELVDAVRALQDGLNARAGVLTGEAAVTLNARNQGMVAGDLVNTAARLQGVAEAGTVLVGEATRRAAERAIVFEDLGGHSLRGKASPVPAWRAVRVVANRGGQGRTDALEPPFVGRDEELRQLKEVLHAVGRERRPRLVRITGPGGIGKSRLAWELEKYVDGVAENIFWHRGRSPSYGEGITFWALGEMVRRRARLAEDDDDEATRTGVAAMLDEYVPDPSERERIRAPLLSLLGVGDAQEGDRQTAFPAWRLLFERIAERGITVLVFEDLQWADSGLLDFIDHLLEWSRGVPLMVVTLARPELFDRRPDWGTAHRHLTALVLEPLSDDAVRQLLEGMVPGLPADATAAIVGRAEGVPLYAVETVRALLADGLLERRGDAFAPAGDLSQIRVPDSLRSLIASRLDGLDPADRALVQDASVLGQVFSVDWLSAITGRAADDLEARLRVLVRRELIDVERDPASPERGQYKFVQSLIREVAYGTIARRDRRARHLAVARHTEALGDEELAGALASHYLAARDASEPGPEADAIASQARIALAAAADRAAALGGHDQALAYLDQALAISSEPAERAPLLDRAARSAAAAATAEAPRFAEEAVEAYAAIGDDVAAATARARLGRVLIDSNEIARAAEMLEAAATSAERLEDPVPLAMTLAHLARAHMRLADPTKAVDAADRALTIAEPRDLEAVIAEAFVNKGSALSQVGRRREATALLAEALEIARNGTDRALELRIRNNYASTLSDDDPARATELLLESMALCRDLGDRGMFNWQAATVAVGLINEGRGWDEHMALLREAFEAAIIPFDRLRIRTLLGFIEAERGERTEERVAEVRALAAQASDPESLFALDMTLSRAALTSGDPAAAHRAAIQAHERRIQNPEVAAAAAMEAAVASRDPETIRRAAAIMEETPGSGRFTLAWKRFARAGRDAVEGRTADAVRGFRAAHDQMNELRQRYVAALLLVAAAELLPDEAEIRASAQAVRPFLEALRATPHLRRLDAALAGGDAPSGVAATAAETPAV